MIVNNKNDQISRIPPPTLEFPIASYPEKILHAIVLSLEAGQKPPIVLDTCVLYDLYRSPLKFKEDFRTLTRILQLGVTVTIVLEWMNLTRKRAGLNLQEGYHVLNQLGMKNLQHDMVSEENYAKATASLGEDRSLNGNRYADICIGLEVAHSQAIGLVTNNIRDFHVFLACGCQPIRFRDIVNLSSRLIRNSLS